MKQEKGFALVTVLLLLAVLTTLLGAHLAITQVELATVRSSRNTITGFYAAEAGLNIRAETIRSIFIGYNNPIGTTPNLTNPCVSGNVGTGDMACKNYAFSNRNVMSYLIDHQAGTIPSYIPIPQGELYQGLNASEYRYTAHSEAQNVDNKTEAILELRFKSRLVPMFQFAAFYNKDLEILPGPAMTLSGPVHTNGDLYLNSNNVLSIAGQITSAGNLYRGRKDTNTSNASSVQVMDPAAYRQLIPLPTSRTLATTSQVAPFNGMIKFKVDKVGVPPPEQLDPTPGSLYWDKADLRIVLRLNSAGYPDTTNVSSGIEIRNADNSVNTSATNSIKTCGYGRISRNPNPQSGGADNTKGPLGTSLTFKNNRENKMIRMLDVDLQNLLECLYRNNFYGLGKTLDDTSETGLVFYLTVSGPGSSLSANNYGVRISNGAKIAAISAAAPSVHGLTIVTDQAAYVQGNYNNPPSPPSPPPLPIPAAILSDSLNVLSEAWWNTASNNFNDSWSTSALSIRIAQNTTQNYAVLSGTDTTGNIEGSGGQNGAYNGGLENYPRFHEEWTGVTFKYRGSLVSLGNPRHVNGGWGGTGGSVYNAPNRDWNYDTSFNDANNLPPLSPRFVYLKQELFVRDFEQ